MTDRNPIIEIDINNKIFKIQTIGDPHFGKSFKTGINTSKIGIREELQFNDFINLLNTPDVSEYIIMGDLFDKFNISNEILLKVYNSLIESFKDRPEVKCHILCGNHDLSKNKNKNSSFEVLKYLIDNNSDINNIFIYTEPCLYNYKDNIYFYFDAYNPFYQDSEININLPKTDNFKLYSFGHWDDPRQSTGYLPSQTLLDGSVMLVSGHYHVPERFTHKGIPFVYTGSLQPYSHAEDPDKILYETFDYLDLENIFTELDGFNELVHQTTINNLKLKNVRINCYPGYIFPHNLDSLSFIYNNIYQNQNSEVTQETDNSTITDFTTMYLMKLKTEHEIEDKVLIQINNFLKDVDSNVSIDLD